MGKRAPRTQSYPAVQTAVICLVLFGAVWAVFGQTLAHDFVNFDDEVYVYRNPDITRGLTSSSIPWAFTHRHARNWHPLTTLSHMLDCSVYGLKAAGHHFTNVLLHSITAVVLFFVVRELTHAEGVSAGVAAIWAIHPLRVESVAWIAERKDVLSGLLFVLTLATYLRYARGPTAARFTAVVLLFAAGLLCKPMLVTVPLIFLLLDYWPLRRFASLRGAGFRSAAVEKIPLFVLAAGSAFATIVAQTGDVGAMDPLPFGLRIGNAVVASAIYLRQLVWPVNLAPFYPHPASSLPIIDVVGALFVLVLITSVAIALRRTAPWLFIGWAWYLIMLMPVIGIVQIGMQAHADRYTYLPQIGLLLAIGYGLRRLTQGFRARLQMMTCVALVAFLALGVAAWRQTQHWKNSHTLWTHAAAVTRENEVAENNLGILLQEEGKLDEAIAHYQRAVAIQTERGHSRYKLTLALSENNLGNAFLRAGNIDQAIAHYRTAIDLRPDYADAFYDLAIGLSEAHDLDGAIESLRRAIDIRADDAAAHARLGDLLRQKHAHAEALVHYEKAVELQPTAIWAEESLAWLLATAPDPSIRNGARALSIAQHTLELPGGQSGHTLRTVAAACATQGNFPEATRTAERAIDLASREGDVATLNSLRADLELYRANIPLRELSPVQ